MKKNGIKALACLMIMATTLTACGDKKEVDYVEDQNVSESEVSTPEASGVASGEGVYEEIPEHITYDVACDKVTISVDADVSVPQRYEQCKVVELEKSVMSDEELKSYVESTFDEGSSFLYMPYNENEIDKLKDKLTTISAEVTDENLRNIINDLYISKLDESAEAYEGSDNEITEEIKFHSINLKASYVDELIKCEICNVIGTIDGEYYIIEAYRDNTNQFVKLSKLSDAASEFTDVGPGYGEMLGTTNSCDYSREEAEQMATDYVNGLGIQNMSVVHINDVLFMGYSSEVEIAMVGDEYSDGYTIDGYNVYLARSYDNYKTVYSTEQFINWYDMVNKDQASGELISLKGKEFIRVQINSDGVVGYEYCNELTENTVISEKANLLDFNSANDMAKGYLAEYGDESDMAFDINRITLGYAIIEDHGKYATVPAWHYFIDDGTEGKSFAFEYPVIIVNALDGTMIESMLVFE